MVKQMIVVRKDLKMRKGKMIAQGAHASMGALIWNMNFDRKDQEIACYVDHPDVWQEWFETGTTKIAVSVDSEEELFVIKDLAQKAGIPYYMVRDAGRTEFNGVPTYTAIAVGPASSEVLDPITGELKLL